MIQQVKHELNDKSSFAELADMARANPVPDEIDVNKPRFLSPENMTREIEDEVGRKLATGEIAYVIFNNLARDYASSLNALEQITNEIEDEAYIQGKSAREISTADLGELVLKKLYNIDKVAYIRFASVYKQFSNLDEFVMEVNKLEAKEKQ